MPIEVKWFFRTTFKRKYPKKDGEFKKKTKSFDLECGFRELSKTVKLNQRCEVIICSIFAAV
ncbi:hypothetical protein FH5T_04340 [Draconibacterium orientale]|uniref:Transposase n=1 Tax=Draconibacterium orientale TaxID=1168034 RepID=A0ABN4D2L1_9BACT|nr:hypothetical protein FH5T_04340 [Draconibacterium orientale]